MLVIIDFSLQIRASNLPIFRYAGVAFNNWAYQAAKGPEIVACP
jgi:hypothetical protein